jgi:UDP-N-acetylglucosamine 2-epimerase (non-hydrolysing)
MKVLTWLGTRPEIIRLSETIKLLDRHCEQTVVYTGQNFAPNLRDVFFADLQLRAPDVDLSIDTSNFGAQAADIFSKSLTILQDLKPDRVLILGDTNSALISIVAARLAIPVFHMEAGNRCYDDRVPEEVNRRIVDHTSTVLLPYTERSMENLVREGIERDRIYVIGNPIYEILRVHADAIEQSEVHSKLGVERGEYLLATMHRAENVDIKSRLEDILTGLDRAGEEFDLPVLVSLHPRTRDKMQHYGLESSARLRLIDPLGFLDFVALEKCARGVISDSGTVQEECSIMHVPSVTIRDVTERAETIEVGSNVLTSTDPERIVSCLRLAFDGEADWNPPPEYVVDNVSRTVGKIILGHLGPVGRVRIGS